ncbi:MAG TPA: hypothetical protein VMA36_08940 [Candidatus Limnocylindria bacterium]|nr:hypothetical protein [Candidatus Limnocylindria bacterium]
MTRYARRSPLHGIALAVLVLAAPLAAPQRASAQNPELQQRVAEIKETMTRNQQALAQYTWQQQETISVNGEVRKQEAFQVQIGADGKPVKTALTASAPQQGRRFGIKHRITEEYEQYGQQLASLAQSYSQLDPGRLQQLYEQGNVLLGSGGTPGVVALVIHNYAKSGDSVTLSFDRQQKALLSMNIASYLSGPSDAVTMTAQFAKLPDGTNHVATSSINGQSKGLTVQQTNANYQKRA